MNPLSAANFFSEAFTWFANLSSKLPQIDFRTFFIVVVALLIGVGVVVGLTFFGSYRFKLTLACKKIIRYLKGVEFIDDDNFGDFTAQCFSQKAPAALRDCWVQYLGVRFGYPSDIVSEQSVYDSQIKRVREIRANIYVAVGLILLAIFAFWGYGTLNGNDMGVIFLAGLLLIGVMYLVLVILNRFLSKRCLETFGTMQEDLDAKVNLQVEKSFATDSSPLADLSAIIDEIVARNTAKELGFEFADGITPIEELIALVPDNGDDKTAEQDVEVDYINMPADEVESIVEEEIVETEIVDSDSNIEDDADDEEAVETDDSEDIWDLYDDDEDIDDEDLLNDGADDESEDEVEQTEDEESEEIENLEEDSHPLDESETDILSQDAEEPVEENNDTGAYALEEENAPVENEEEASSGLDNDSDNEVVDNEENPVDGNYDEQSQNEDTEDKSESDTENIKPDSDDDGSDEAEGFNSPTEDGVAAGENDADTEDDEPEVRYVVDGPVDEDEIVKPAKLVKLPNLVDYMLAQNLSRKVKIQMAMLLVSSYKKFENSAEDKAIIVNCMKKLMFDLQTKR